MFLSWSLIKREKPIFLLYIYVEIRTNVLAELQKSHGYAGVTREKGLQNGKSVRKVSRQHTT